MGKKRVRSDTFGYLQRSFIGCVSTVDQQEAREVGEKVAQCAIWHNVDIPVSIYRTDICSVDNRLTQLPDASRNTRSMPDEFINETINCIFILPNTCNDVTDMFKYYLLPLLESNIPQAHRLRDPMVEKKLNK